MDLTALFRWMTGRSAETPQTTSSAEPSPPSEKRRTGRIVPPAGDVDLDGVGIFPVHDLSFGGLGLKVADSSESVFSSGKTVAAKVRIEGIHFETHLMLRNLGADQVGCSFVDLSPGHSRILNEFLKPRILGHSLHEIKTSALKNPDPQLRQRWFQGDEGTQIYFWQNQDGELVKEEFYFLNFVIVFDPKSGSLQTGTIREEAGGASHYGRLERNQIVFFTTPSHRILKMGRTVLRASSLPPEATEKLLSRIEHEERCAFHRLVVEGKDRGVRFVLEGEWAPLALQVVTLCQFGISFLPPDEFAGKQLPMGSLWPGHLRLAEEEIPATFKLAYANEELLSGRLMLANPADADRIMAFLAPRLLGSSLEVAPPPSEDKPFTPPGSRVYLLVGFHNTHLLSLVAPGNRLVYGRLAFMDRTLVCDKGTLSGFACPRGIIFPSDWDLPLENVEKLSLDEGNLLATCQEILASARLPEEVSLAWQVVFKK